MADVAIYTGRYDYDHAMKVEASYACQGFSTGIKFDEIGWQYYVELTKQDQLESSEENTTNECQAEEHVTIPIKDLAQYMGISDGALRGWRRNGTGPIAHKDNDRVFYYPGDVEVYLRSVYIKLYNTQAPESFLGGRAFIRDTDAQDILLVNRDVIAGWRHRFIGPNYFTFESLVRYRPEDIEAFAEMMRHGYGPSVRTSARLPVNNGTVETSTATSNGNYESEWLGIWS